MHPIQTFSDRHLMAQRSLHRQSDGYGRHRHLYLETPLRQLHRAVAARVAPRRPTLLDYGCGKGEFLNALRQLDLFADLAGYDPGVPGFATRPDRQYDIVLCLDVLDTVEPRYLDAVIEDVTRCTADTALFDCLTRPKPGGRLTPHPPFYWTHLIRSYMAVIGSEVAFPEMVGFERVLITARPPPPAAVAPVQDGSRPRSSPSQGS